MKNLNLMQKIQTGCGGNGNRFESREECDSICQHRQGKLKDKITKINSNNFLQQEKEKQKIQNLFYKYFFGSQLE